MLFINEYLWHTALFLNHSEQCFSSLRNKIVCSQQPVHIFPFDLHLLSCQSAIIPVFKLQYLKWKMFKIDSLTTTCNCQTKPFFLQLIYARKVFYHYLSSQPNRKIVLKLMLNFVFQKLDITMFVTSDLKKTVANF